MNSGLILMLRCCVVLKFILVLTLILRLPIFMDTLYCFVLTGITNVFSGAVVIKMIIYLF